MTHPSYYSDIQAEYKNKVSPFEEEIEKDLRRAFPKHQFFQNDLNIDMLRRVLTAYAWRNPIIGYAQSMNMICGSLLFVLPEEAAFWVLVSVCEDVVPGYYNKSLGKKFPTSNPRLLIKLFFHCFYFLKSCLNGWFGNFWAIDKEIFPRSSKTFGKCWSFDWNRCNFLVLNSLHWNLFSWGLFSFFLFSIMIHFVFFPFN